MHGKQTEVRKRGGKIMPPVRGLLPSLGGLASWHPEEPTCTPLQSVSRKKTHWWLPSTHGATSRVLSRNKGGPRRSRHSNQKPGDPPRCLCPCSPPVGSGCEPCRGPSSQAQGQRSGRPPPPAPLSIRKKLKGLLFHSVRRPQTSPLLVKMHPVVHAGKLLVHR